MRVNLISNHIILLSNVFTVEASVRILFFKLEKEYWSILKPFLILLNQLPETIKYVKPHGDINTVDIPLDNVVVKGLMSIPPFHEPARPYFSELSRLRDDIQKDYGIELPFLSMGMSGDYVEAISEGATHIRVGTSIFGER